MRARIKPDEISHQTVVSAHRHHFTHEWSEFDPAFAEQVKANPYLEIEPEPKKAKTKPAELEPGGEG